MLDLEITVCQKVRCYACSCPDARRFYIGNVPYNLCESCIDAITAVSKDLKTILKYTDFYEEQKEGL